MAHEAEKQELKDKVERLLTAKFWGDSRAAFAYYDMNGDGKIDRRELMDLLKDAGVGNWLTRGSWASGIIAALDRDGDGAISQDELDAWTK